MNRSISAPSPLSPTPWPADAFRWYRSVVFGALLGIAFAVVPVAIGIVLARQSAGHAIASLPLRTVIVSQFLAYVPVAALLLAGLPWLARRSLPELGLRSPGIHDLAWGLGGAVAMFAVAQTIGVVEENLLHQKLRETAVDLLRHARGADLLGFAGLAVVAAPFVEELIFRGFFFNAFRRYQPAATAAVLSAILFGLAHYDKNSPTAVLPLIGGGIVLAWVYHRSGSLFSSMIAHATFNFVTVLAIAAGSVR